MTQRIYTTLAKALFIGALVFIVSSCKNDLNQVNALTTVSDTAQLSGKDVELTRSLNGHIAVRMRGKEVRQLSMADNTFEFPQGIELFMYDTLGNVTSHMSADYSIYYDKKGIWEAKSNVDVSNEKGDRLNTEYLVWSRDKATFETDQFVKISTADGVIYGDGMVSDQNFTNWEVKNGRGVFNLEDE